MNQITKAILLSILTTFAISCQKSDTNDLQDAQLCLNTAPASEAMNCVSKISANTSENAYKLRCSAVFIANGFGSPDSFTLALDQIQSGPSTCSGTCSGSLVAMSTLNFGTSASDLDEANYATSECDNSGVKNYSELSKIFKIGTVLANAAAGLPGGLTLENMDDAAAALSGAGAIAVGEVVQAMHTSACADTTNASDSTIQFCTEVSAAIDGGATPEKIGECFVKTMADPAFDCSTL